MTGQPATLPDLQSSVRDAVEAALSRKAAELRVLDIGAVSDFTDYFVICSGTNQRQVQAIADAVLEVLRPAKVRPLSVEGYDHGHWVLLDFGSFLVHIFDDETREFYALEKLWSDGGDVTAAMVG